MKIDNFTIIIFGGAGDLTGRKLMPSIYQLAKHKKLPARFRIIGVDRLAQTTEDYRPNIKTKIDLLAPEMIEDPADFQEFCNNIFYVSGDFNDINTYQRLAEEIKTVEDREGICDNLLYYLATPPSIAPIIISKLQEAKLGGKEGNCRGWRKIIIEKPYGRDIKSAQELNKIVGAVFHENQIYRIDHYLAKETVQNVLVLRFANGIFEPLWNRNFVQHVQITIAENFGIKHRGAYYEEAGLVRDIIQNHGLQLLALIAMEPPVSMEADAIRDEKVKVFKSIKRIKPDEASNHVVIGQYGGYHRERNVSFQSKIETYAAIKFLVDNARWKDVPFYMRAGKNLKNTVTEIIIRFKHPPIEFFGHSKQHAEANILRLQIQPEEKISISFGAKRPGDELVMDPVFMEFDYKTSFGMERLTPYHRLLYDAMAGDQTRFIRRDGVEQCWEIIDLIEEGIKKFKQPLTYMPKTWGPAQSNKLLERDGFEWYQK